MSSSVLYDIPGPQARRRTLISSLVAAVIVAVVIVLVVLRLAEQGQFSGEKWGPLVNPFDPSFAAVWNLLGQALVATLTAAGLTLVFSLVIGTIFAVTRVTASRSYRWLVVGVIELLRGVPVVIAIFFAARVLPEVGISLPILWYLVIGLTAYNSVIIAEIIRAGIASLPRGQSEAGYSLGLTRGQVLSTILLPQAFRVMLPALISQLVVIVKDTSLGFIISYEEFVRTANIIIQTLRNPIQTYIIVAIIFIAINYSLGKLAEYVERRLSRARTTAAAPTHAGAVDTGAAGGG
ncbi:amino acid ABC transporter permease [Pseudonocardia bannensis]|uniref:Amino acid ABC transporter permease n=1 Tax=Pseudonocardia bannensis TaxID=630973 RepID=A0A848DCN4_9PSEU|nr:amino acid ABC transporter permease [Pseudonocardia bannensis]NMH90347.1 amino acid ABC transporter permease [Pseudonocardia bannensis]